MRRERARGLGGTRPLGLAQTRLQRAFSDHVSGCDVASPTACAETIHTTRWAQKTAWEASAHALEAESTGSVRNQAESGVAGMVRTGSSGRLRPFLEVPKPSRDALKPLAYQTL